MSKNRLITRLKWYFPMERFHAFVTFPIVIIYLLFSFPTHSIVFLIYGLLICIVILYQGQHYWKLKLKRLQGESFDNTENIKFFKTSKKINRILIGLIPLFFLLQLGLQNWNIGVNKMLFWGLLANFFAVLEHINYYHTQLMIDNEYDLKYLLRNKRLKKASLAKDLLDGKI